MLCNICRSIQFMTSYHNCYCYAFTAVSADSALQNLAKSECLNDDDCKKVLDVGGGDGTIAAILVKEHLHSGVNIFVYNLPASAQLARRNIKNCGCGDQVQVIDGNFMTDNNFPGGPYDAIMFNRV